MHTQKKIAFFDLDGTLACGNRPPHPDDAAAIRALRRQGHYAFLCTGRAVGFLYKEILDIGFDGIVAGAGAYITVGDQLLFRRTVPAHKLREIIGYYQNRDQVCVLEGERSTFQVNRHLPMPSVYLPLPEGPLSDAWFEDNPITKLTVIGQLDEAGQRLLEGYLTIQHPAYAESMPAGCCKSEGMRRVLEHLGIPRANSLAFGDSRNDLDMLRYAGFGVAMGGSEEVVCAAADYVTDRLENAGVAKALRKFVLTGQTDKGEV